MVKYESGKQDGLDFYVPRKNEKVMDFFIPSEYFGEKVEKIYAELIFSVPNSLVKKVMEERKLEKWSNERLDKWRLDEWLWEEADDILYQAILENKLVSLSYEY